MLTLFTLICTAILALFLYLLRVILPTFFHISNALTSTEDDGRSFTEKFDELLSLRQTYESGRKLQELQAGVFPPDITPPVVLVLSNSDDADSLYDLLLIGCGVGEVMAAQSELGNIMILPACTNKGRNHLLGALQEKELSAPVFVSLPCYSDKQLLEAFAALEELQRLAFLYPNQMILLQEHLAECSQTSSFQSETVNALKATLKKGQLEMAQAQWLLLFDHIRNDRYNDFLFALHYVERALTSLAEEYALPPADSIDSYMTDLATLQSQIYARLKAISEASSRQQRQMLDSLSNQVWEKIYQLYPDENCCSQMIAEQLDMSPAYLNRQFRAAAGISVNDAIQHVRIDKVCKLLRQSELPVEQLARQVGYSNNAKYFFVLFKKYTGKTPSQFRSDLTD